MEKAKETIPIDKKDIVDYLQQAIRKTPRLMIELLIKDVILYKDRIEIHLNYTGLIRHDAEKRRAFFILQIFKRCRYETQVKSSD